MTRKYQSIDERVDDLEKQVMDILTGYRKNLDDLAASAHRHETAQRRWEWSHIRPRLVNGLLVLGLAWGAFITIVEVLARFGVI